MSEQVVLSTLLKEQFPRWVSGAHRYCGDETVVIKRDGILEVCRFLRDDPRAAMNFLMVVTGVDYLAFGKRDESMPLLATPSPLPYFMKPKPVAESWERVGADGARFEVVYHLYSLARNHRLRLKVPIAEADPVVPSVTGLWRSADWFEREIWDMFGIRFTGHPNLKRIMMYDAFEGHPLRKDYPVAKRQPILGPAN